MRYRLLSVCALSALLFPAIAAAQEFPFQIRVQQDGNVYTVTNNASLAFAADSVGKSAEAKVTVTYLGQSGAVIPSAPQLLGSVSFQIGSLGQVPLTLKTNDSFTFDIRYTATNSKAALAQLLIGYQLQPGSATAPASAGTITFNLAGVAPELIVSYSLQSDSNVLSLAPGSQLEFDPTPVGTTASATIIVSNRGSGPGKINTVSVTGAAFQVLGLPLLPAPLAAGSDMRFLIRYRPSRIGSDAGALQMSLGDVAFSASLAGSSVGAAFAYDVVRDTTTTAVAPGGKISFDDTPVGSTTSVVVRVHNTGNGSGVLGGISVSGRGFALNNLPFLPVTMAPGDSFTFALAFVPADPGSSTGRLLIGNDVFDLSGTGIGPKLVFSYLSGSATKAVLPGGGVVFSPTQIGQTATLQFSIQNAGTTAATIASIGVGANAPAFRTDSLPVFPLTLQPNASVTFSIAFSPVAIGFATVPLQVDSQSFTLSGLGDPPPPLPDYRLATASDAQGPMQQIALTLALASPYSLPLKGTLTVTFESTAFSIDPALQFSSGGRTVTFSIPANSTQAVFPNGNGQVRLQTGTVAGAIVITPSFTTDSGVPLTPGSLQPLRLQVAEAPPQLLSVQVAGKTAATLDLLVSGYATTRTLSKLVFQFTTASDVRVAGQQVTIDLESAAANWYSNAGSQAFGGQFAITMPFTLSSTSGGTASAVDQLQSVSVVAANALGSSNSLTTNLK